MRQTELLYGIDVCDKSGRNVGQSRVAAAKGISQVIFSRIVMCAPGMLILPVIMERLEKLDWMKRIQVLHAPIQVMFVGCLWVTFLLVCVFELKFIKRIFNCVVSNNCDYNWRYFHFIWSGSGNELMLHQTICTYFKCVKYVCFYNIKRLRVTNVWWLLNFNFQLNIYGTCCLWIIPSKLVSSHRFQYIHLNVFLASIFSHFLTIFGVEMYIVLYKY